MIPAIEAVDDTVLEPLVAATADHTYVLTVAAVVLGKPDNNVNVRPVAVGVVNVSPSSSTQPITTIRLPLNHDIEPVVRAVPAVAVQVLPEVCNSVGAGIS